MKRKDLTNNIYGCLKVLSINEEETKQQFKKRLIWNCECLKCGKIVSIRGENLTSGNTTGHGCDKGEKIAQKLKKVNQIEIDKDNNLIRLIPNNTRNIFMADLEDLELVKEYCWYEDKKHNYLITRLKDNSKLLFHRLIFFRSVENTLNDKTIDHASRDKYDCRKQNLRICTLSQNAQNQSIPKNNTSGIIGVNYSSNDKKWRAYVCVDKKYISLGYYNNKIDAIKARLNGEKIYYKEYAPQKHLFEKYGI